MIELYRIRQEHWDYASEARHSLWIKVALQWRGAMEWFTIEMWRLLKRKVLIFELLYGDITSF